MQKRILSLIYVAAVFALLMGGCQALPVKVSTQTLEVTATRTLIPTETLTPAATPAPLPTSTPTNTPYPLPEEALSTENAAQIRQLTRLVKGRITALEYSPDGNHLAV